MITDSFRKEMKSGIMELLQPMQWVRAVWEEGSAATGYLDDYSDLDLVLVVEGDRIEEAFRYYYFSSTTNCDELQLVPVIALIMYIPGGREEMSIDPESFPLSVSITQRLEIS